LLTLVDKFLDSRDFFFADTIHAVLKELRRCRQFAADIEQLVLDSAQDTVQKTMPLAGVETFLVEHPSQADDGIQFVDGAVGVDARDGAGAGRVVAITYEYGNAFVIVAGLLNMLVVLDAFDIGMGRK